MLKYKDYCGSVEVDTDNCLVGNVLFIRDTVMYFSEDVAGIQKAFEEAVDQYLLDCANLKREPNQPFFVDPN